MNMLIKEVIEKLVGTQCTNMGVVNIEKSKWYVIFNFKLGKKEGFKAMQKWHWEMLLNEESLNHFVDIMEGVSIYDFEAEELKITMYCENDPRWEVDGWKKEDIEYWERENKNTKKNWEQYWENIVKSVTEED